MRNSFRLQAPDHHGTGLKERSKRAKKSCLCTTLTGTKHLPSASGPVNVCPLKRNGRKRLEADSTGIITPGETTTSTDLKNICSRQREPAASTPRKSCRQILKVPTPCLSVHTNPTVMVSTT